MLKKVIVFSCLTALTGMTAFAEAPKLLLMKFHADWCGSCKAMGPLLEDLQGKYDGKPVLFVSLDRTNRSTESQAAMTAYAMQQGAVYEATKGTGKLILIDTASGEILDTFTREHDIKTIGKALDAQLAK
jgi:thiol-disulfide isomerase/thioredoxin